MSLHLAVEGKSNVFHNQSITQSIICCGTPHPMLGAPNNKNS